MPFDRATLPQEFFDVTSAQLLLQPEPQYLFAKLIKGALEASLDDDASLGMPIPGRQFGQNGAPFGNVEDGRLTLSDPIYGTAVTVVTELGEENVGHTVRLNRPVYVDSAYDMTSRSVPAGTTISTTPTNVGENQVPITLQRFAGPYDVGQGSVAPYAVERFDAGRSIHSMSAIKNRHLARDFDKTIDKFGVSLFDLAATIVRPKGFTADNDSKIAGDAPLDLNTLLRANTALDKLSIPVFPNGRRMAVLQPDQCEQLTEDRQFNKLAVFEKDFNPLFAGSYWKTIGEIDIFKSVTLTTQNNGSSIPIRYGQLFGPGAIGVGAGGMPRTAYNSQDNYGETALVIWLWYAGFTCLDNRFIARLATS